jgi:hypothetical protein
MVIKSGTKLLCIDAKEKGIPISEGTTYTVSIYRKDGEKAWGDGEKGPPGVALKERPGEYYRLDRFEVVE